MLCTFGPMQYKIYDIFFEYMGADKIFDFMEWAIYGKDHLIFPVFLFRFWNKNHGDKFFINEDCHVDQIVNTILILWGERDKESPL